VRARKIVDATVSNTTVPSRRQPNYAVAPRIVCIPPNDLPRLVRQEASYVIIGAGKTAIDSCCWLLGNGANPDSICWIMPRDSWLLDRKNFQPGQEFFLANVRSLANQVEALAVAETIEQVFAGLEVRGEWRRIDPSITPTAYHCAIVSDGELSELRRIRNIVRLGRVTRIDATRIVLQRGEIPTRADVLHVDCSAPGIPPSNEKPIFLSDRITLQWVRMCQPAFSAAFIAHVEASYQNDLEKNRLCTPVPTPQEPVDWLRMMAADMANRYHWSKDEGLRGWMSQSRLDHLTAQFAALKPKDTAEMAELQRYLKNAGPAVAKLKHLLNGRS